MSIIEKIRSEVERRKNTAETLRERNVCIDILDYLNTLQEKPVSEDLDEAANEFAHHYDNGTCDGIAQDCFKAGAEWRNVKDGELMAIVYGDGIKIGMTKQKEQMMKEAVERIVKEDAGGYPYIDATELYDYTEEKRLAKKGDKVRIIIVKEEGK